MAQVTMTGKEYEEFLAVKNRYEELMFLMVGARFPKISEKEEDDKWYLQQTFNYRDIYPKWVLDTIKPAIINYVHTLNEVQFKNLVKHDLHHYDPHAGEFTTYMRNDATVDILEDYAVYARWNSVKGEEDDEQ